MLRSRRILARSDAQEVAPRRASGSSARWIASADRSLSDPKRIPSGPGRGNSRRYVSPSRLRRAQGPGHRLRSGSRRPRLDESYMRRLTVRVARHDRAWDGTVRPSVQFGCVRTACRDPSFFAAMSGDGPRLVRAHVSSSGRMRASGVLEGTWTVLLYSRLGGHDRLRRTDRFSRLIARYP